MPISSIGCALCGLRLCVECFGVHTEPPTVQRVAPEDRAFDKSRLHREVDAQYADDKRTFLERLCTVREELENSSLATEHLPAHWATSSRPPARNWAVSLIQAPSLLQGLQACLSTNSAFLGTGRDVRPGPSYSKLQLACAWRVEHHDLWPEYSRALQKVRTHQVQVDMPELKMQNEAASLSNEVEDWAVALGCGLDGSVCEKVLAHGTKPEHVASVLANGFNERFCGGIFGHATYLAEDCGKCDQYTTPDSGEDAHSTLHRILYADCGIPHPGVVNYIFICRAVLGRAARSQDGELDLSTSSPIWARTSEKRELAAIPGTSPPVPYHSLVVEVGTRIKRFREILVCHSARIYPEYLIAYRRV